MQKLFSATILFAIVLAPTMVYAAPKNEMVGVWKLVSAIADPDGKKITMFGEHGSGLLIFTSDLHYVTVLHNPNAPKFQSNSRMAGTPEENKAAVQGGIGAYGTYSVDQNGHINGGHIDGSTYPNWNNTDETTRVVTVEGDRMTESLIGSTGLPVVLVFQRLN
jgi:hypothetical protein